MVEIIGAINFINGFMELITVSKLYKSHIWEEYIQLKGLIVAIYFSSR